MAVVPLPKTNRPICLSPADVNTPDAPRKLAVSTQSLANGTMGPSQAAGGAQPLTQRKRLLKAPTLAELDSSESDVRSWTRVCWLCSIDDPLYGTPSKLRKVKMLHTVAMVTWLWATLWVRP